MSSVDVNCALGPPSAATGQNSERVLVDCGIVVVLLEEAPGAAAVGIGAVQSVRAMLP